IGDLELPEGVKAILDAERHIAHVTIVKEATEEADESTESSEVASPEVITGSSESTEGDDS
ncbi:MAG: 50S ribosomal protein L25/general stress protein Ctc, partial [Phycisphaerales bacterium]